MEGASGEVGEQIGVERGGCKGSVGGTAEPSTSALSTPWLDGGHQPDSGGQGDGEVETPDGTIEEDNQLHEEENYMLGKYFSK